MAQKVCKNCKLIYEGQKCPVCFSEEFTDSFKGRIDVIKPEESEIAKNIGIKKKGSYAIRIG